MYHGRFSFVSVPAKYKPSLVLDCSISSVFEREDEVIGCGYFPAWPVQNHQLERYSPHEVNQIFLIALVVGCLIALGSGGLRISVHMAGEKAKAFLTLFTEKCLAALESTFSWIFFSSNR